MVHALQLTQKLLRPGGWLVNVHELPVPHLIEVTAPDAVHKVGWILDKDDFDTTRSSLRAVTQVVADGLFVLEDERNFIYNIYADDLTELQAFLAEWWSSAVVAERTIDRIDSLVRDAALPTRITLCLQARMSKLKAV